MTILIIVSIIVTGSFPTGTHTVPHLVEKVWGCVDTPTYFSVSVKNDIDIVLFIFRLYKEQGSVLDYVGSFSFLILLNYLTLTRMLSLRMEATTH